MVCSRFASSEPGILLLPTAYSSMRRLQWISSTIRSTVSSETISMVLWISRKKSVG